MRTATWFFAVLTAGCAFAGTPEDYLAGVQEQVFRTIRSAPRYTCVQETKRTLSIHQAGKSLPNCSDFAGAPSRVLSTDRLRLDVMVSQGNEYFAWAGSKRFDSSEITDFVAGGMIGSGDFISYLIDIFANPGARFLFRGIVHEFDQTLAKFSFRVPVEASHYIIKVGDMRETVGFEGYFWLDPDRSELLRLSVSVPHPPHDADCCSMSSDVDYQRVQLGSIEFQLPSRVVMTELIADGRLYRNERRYTRCREYSAESRIFGDEVPVLKEHGNRYIVTRAPAPLQVFAVALANALDLDTAAAGDAVRTTLLKPLRDASGRVIAAKGAAVQARILKFEESFDPKPTATIGLVLETLETEAGPVALSVTALGQSGGNEFGRPEQRGVRGRIDMGIYTLQGKSRRVRKGFTTGWVTR